jgi:tripartite-type tricarboxylate transporter receptor subunit TctC
MRHGFASVCAFVLLATPALAQTGDPFYRGKQITLIIASGAGGGYDTYARIFARHATNYIDGAPVFIPKNMPAAGGLQAASILYNQSDRDGSTIAALTNGVAMDPLFGNTAARFDAREFGWLGSIGKLQNVCATWHESPVKTFEQARDREVIVAGAGATSNTAIMPRVANALLGTKFKIIAGYDPNAGLNKALEGGEVEGICGLGWSTLTASRPDWIRDHKLNVLVQFGMEKLPDLPDTPNARDLVSDPHKKGVLELILIRQEMGRPFAAPPGIPPQRLAILRRAFEQTMKDKDFLTEAQRMQMDVDPLTGPQIDDLMAFAYKQPKALVDDAAQLVMPAGETRKPD